MKDTYNQGDNPNPSEQPDAGQKKKYVFFIDRKKFETDQPTLTAGQILTNFAKVDSTKNTLAIKQNGSFVEITDNEAPIEMKEGLHFTVFNNESTPVS